MIWLAIQYPPLLVLNLLTLAVAVWGVLVNSWMLCFTIRRTILVRRSGEARRDPVAKLEMRRAVRCETVYLAVQIILLAVSIHQFFHVVPTLPDSAVSFFFGSMAARAATSLLIAYLSAHDLIDRRRIARELDKLHPETPASQVG